MATAPELRISQHDDRPARAQAVVERRGRYGWETRLGFPVAAGFSPAHQPDWSWQVKALAAQEGVRLHLWRLQQRGLWTFERPLAPLSPAHLLSLLRAGDIPSLIDFLMPIPGGVRADADLGAPSLASYQALMDGGLSSPAVAAFDTDAYFAEKMVGGPDPTRLRRLRAAPAKFPLTTAHLASVPALAGDDLDAAIAGGRVYWIDYQDNEALAGGTHASAPKFMYAPMVAFAVPRAGGPLLPFAIQCGQDPSPRPIYTPADGHSWRIARNCVSAAHNTYHEVLTHLGFTHLISEAIFVSALRTLAPEHPVMALLARHCEGTLLINKLAVDLLIQPGRAVEYLIGSDLKTTHPWLAKHRREHSFRGNYLPARFAAAGTGEAKLLPHHPYREDGLLVWSAIFEWMADFVGVFYADDAAVRADHELQAWAREVSSPDGGCVRDFGVAAGAIADRDDLVHVLTMILWTAGPQHAAVNFTQKDHLSFLPANPLAGFTAEPQGRAHDERDWLANLPPLDVAVHQHCIMTFLGSVRHTTLGDYGRDFDATPVAEASRRFARRLTAVEETIIGRNSRRQQPYPYLLPSLIPNSTNI